MSVADLQVATDAETKIRAEMKEIEDTENARNYVFSKSELERIFSKSELERVRMDSF